MSYVALPVQSCGTTVIEVIKRGQIIPKIIFLLSVEEVLKSYGAVSKRPTNSGNKRK